MVQGAAMYMQERIEALRRDIDKHSKAKVKKGQQAPPAAKVKTPLLFPHPCFYEPCLCTTSVHHVYVPLCVTSMYHYVSHLCTTSIYHFCFYAPCHAICVQQFVLHDGFVCSASCRKE